MADGQQFFQRGNHEWQRDSWNHHDSNDGSEGSGGSVSAPEIDASSAVAAFMLLAGGLIVLRSRVRS